MLLKGISPHQGIKEFYSAKFLRLLRRWPSCRSTQLIQMRDIDTECFATVFRNYSLVFTRQLLCRCQAQGNNTFDQFIQWGVGLLKKTLGPGQQRQQDEVPEDRALQQAHPEPEEPSRPAESVGSSGEPSASRPEGEGQSEASALTAQMEERISEYRHMVMTGKEITEDWPPPGTPTWSDWLSVRHFLQTFLLAGLLLSAMPCKT